MTSITALIESAFRRWPERVAIEEPGGAAIDYAELGSLVGDVRALLSSAGVARGDRVGICLPKTIDAVGAIFGVLTAGGAYVPVDPDGPMARAAYILSDCGVRAVFVDARLAPGLRSELAALGTAPRLFELDGPGSGAALRTLLSAGPGLPAAASIVSGDDLAYILYTSGSTGRPKGVMLSHHNATAFVDWCARTFAPTSDDRFSSHAPLHFDLSILDLYLPLTCGARVVLIDAATGKEPRTLAELIVRHGVTHWYSTPSVLTVLAQYGRLEEYDGFTLRRVLFAGEVFPVRHLRAVRSLWPDASFHNLYGPTETNVCTAYRIPDAIDPDRAEPYPIGRVCDHLRGKLIDAAGAEVAPGDGGELCISGDNVMQGYWNLPAETARAFVVDADGVRWYRTGDIVVEGEGGELTFVGRRDRMVKRRGYRIELGEIEAALYRHEAVEEAAVVATRDAEGGPMITAFARCAPDATPTLIAMKRFCAQELPQWAVPDRFVFVPSLPRTSTDKVDYRSLAGLV